MLLALGPPFENHCVRERRIWKPEDQLERNGHEMKGDEGTGLSDPPSVGRGTHMVAMGDAVPRCGECEQNQALTVDLLKLEVDEGKAVQSRDARQGRSTGNKARSQTSG